MVSYVMHSSKEETKNDGVLKPVSKSNLLDFALTWKCLITTHPSRSPLLPTDYTEKIISRYLN